MTERRHLQLTFVHATGEIGIRADAGPPATLTPREALELAARLDDAAHQALKVTAAYGREG